MALVPARCTQCGGNIEVDNTKEAGVCKYCGTAFITEKVVNNYNSYVTNNINIKHANIINETIGADELYSKAITFAKLGEKIKALKVFEELINKFPNDYRGWLGYIIVQTNDFTELSWSEKQIEKYFNHALAVANENGKEEVQQYLVKYDNLKTKKRADEIQAIKNAEYCNQFNYTTVMKVLGFWMQSTINKHGVPIEDGHSYKPEFTYVLANTVKYKYYYMRTNYDNPSEKVKEYSQEYVDNMDRYVDGNIEELFADVKNETSKKSGCYIATCVYGSYDCPEVWTLRRFRDYTLDTTWYGKVFIKCYYAISPTLVKLLGNKKWFVSSWKKTLDKMVTHLNANGVDNTRYNDK